MCMDNKDDVAFLESTEGKQTLVQVIVDGLEVYRKETAPVADYYKKTGALYSTLLSESANRMKAEVAKDVIEYLKNK